MSISPRWNFALRFVRGLQPFLDPATSSPPTKFVLLSTPRSGTTWVIDQLNSHPEIVCYSEVFAHDHFGNMPDGGCQDMLTWDSYATLKLMERGRLGRLRLYFEYLDQEVFACRSNAHAIGFKLMYSQAERGFGIPAYLKLRQVSVVHLLRANHLDALLSEEARKIRKYFHTDDERGATPIQICVEPQTLPYRLEQREQLLFEARQFYSNLGVPYLEIRYEDLLESRQSLSEVLEFLRVEPNADRLTSPLKKLNTTSHRDLIANFDDVENVLRDTQFANLLH